MTAICTSSGPSQVKPGFGPIIFGSVGLVEALASRFLDPKLVPFASFATGAVSFDLATICTVDPPADPNMSATDFAALILPEAIANFTGAQAKFAQLIERMVWYAMCQCVTGPTPAFPAVTVPAPLPVINPSQILPATGQSCLALTSEQQTPVVNDFGCLEPLIAPRASSFTGIAAETLSVPTGATSLVWTWNTGSGAATTALYDFQIVWYTAGRALISASNSTGHATGLSGSVGPITVPSTAAFWQLAYAENGGPVGAGTLISGGVTFFCNGANSGTVIQPCCPPDPILQNRLDALLALVTIIQRQIVPFAYTSGTIHSGLTGTGSFAIQGLLGVKVELTTDSASLGQVTGTPPELFDRGFVTLGTADGYPQDYRIEHNPQIILPPRASAFTTLGYTLNPLVTARITELIREP